MLKQKHERKKDAKIINAILNG